MLTKNQRGQTLILMLIVTVISLTIGVAISSRAVSTLKQTSYTAQAGKAQKAADAGVEEALAVDDLSGWLGDHAVDLGGGATATYTVEEVGGGTTVKATLEKDQTTQIDLAGYPSGQDVDIYWVLQGTEETSKAALILAFIYDDGGTIKLEKHTYDPVDLRRGNNNFGDPNDGDFLVGGETYKHHARITTPSGTNQALRVRPLYNGTPNSFVIQSTGPDFPTQGHKITSTGTYGEAEWTVEVTKMNPALPSIFDYAIFSESDLTK